MRRLARASLLALCLCACRAVVRSGLEEGEADRLVVALEGAAIGASKVLDHRAGGRDRYRVEVAANETAHALGVLAASAPEERPQPGFAELYADPGLVPTLGEERARWSAATSGELARSLRALHGVVDARVHLAVAERGSEAFAAEHQVTRASVLVTRRAGLPPVDERAVRSLVTGAVDGLAPERVSLVQDEAPAARREHLVRVGPIRVTAESAGMLKLALGTALVLDAALALALVGAVARRRRRPRSGT